MYIFFKLKRFFFTFKILSFFHTFFAIDVFIHVLIAPPLLKQNGYRTYMYSSFQSHNLAAYS